jgi:hypothetical protein
MRISKFQKWSIIAGAFCLLVHWFVPARIVEVVHGQGIFPLVSWVLDHTLNLLPFSIIYLIIPLLLFGLLRSFKGFQLRSLRRWQTWSNFFLQTISFFGLIVALFYIFWGFNYDRLQLSDRLSWTISPILPEEFLVEGKLQAHRLGQFTSEQREGIATNVTYQHYRLLEAIMRKEARQLAEELGYLDRERVRCRQLAPSGILLRISTAGFYNPLTGECNIDKGLHPLQKPFVMAHEFFHGMGVTGEGDCNFLAYILCSRSKVDYVRYSGELCYWRYMRHALRRSQEAIYDELVEGLPLFVNQDLDEIDEIILKYPDIAPHMRDALYNAYLRSNKIGDGMANYNRILQLVINWRKNNLELN